MLGSLHRQKSHETKHPLEEEHTLFFSFFSHLFSYKETHTLITYLHVFWCYHNLNLLFCIE